MQFLEREETIIAPATPVGRSAVALVRLSGEDAFPLTNQIFRGKRLKNFFQLSPATLCQAELISPDGIWFDSALVARFPAPHSYTGEDYVEFHLHGNPLIVERLISWFCQKGCRLARPGEFTGRAFLNGKRDLRQTSAVADLINAENQVVLENARNQLSGESGPLFNRWTKIIQNLLVEIEARLDFSEEGLPPLPRVEIKTLLHQVGTDVAVLRERSQINQRLIGQSRVVIIGKPNAGKSSLFNALLGQERVLVSPYPGTTRDWIESPLSLSADLTITLTDTAGLLSPEQNALERVAGEQTKKVLRQAALLLWVIDSTRPWEDADRGIRDLLTEADVPVYLVYNKIDQPPVLLPDEFLRQVSDYWPKVQWVRLSARLGEGIKDLVAVLRDFFQSQRGKISPGYFLAHLWELVILDTLAESIAAAIQLLAGEETGEELLAEELRRGLQAIGELTGRVENEQVLQEIFSRFCVGK